MPIIERSVLDGHDHTACSAKVRQPGYWHVAPAMEGVLGTLRRTWIPDRSTIECQYDRRQVDPACAAAKCAQIGGF